MDIDEGKLPVAAIADVAAVSWFWLVSWLVVCLYSISLYSVSDFWLPPNLFQAWLPPTFVLYSLSSQFSTSRYASTSLLCAFHAAAILSVQLPLAPAVDAEAEPELPLEEACVDEPPEVPVFADAEPAEDPSLDTPVLYKRWSTTQRSILPLSPPKFFRCNKLGKDASCGDGEGDLLDIFVSIFFFFLK